mgnify:CR=1 FL=1
MAVFDWRLGLMCLIPAAIAFVLMGSAMMGPKLAADMKEYQNALESMSSEAVEYVRGIPVVKTFGQTIFSFRRFKKAIDEYEKWTVSYTKSMMMPMVGFTTAVNAVFAVLILSAYLFTGHGVTDTFILNLLFYILISSILTVTLMKIAYAGESNMIVTDALNRMDSILDLSPLAEAEKPKSPANASVPWKMWYLPMTVLSGMRSTALPWRFRQDSTLPLWGRPAAERLPSPHWLHGSGM